MLTLIYPKIWVCTNLLLFRHHYLLQTAHFMSILKFNEHINHILSRVKKSVGLLRKFQLVFPRSSLLTVYKTFIRRHFDDADVYDQNYKSSFHKRLESIQYNAALTVTGVVRGSSKKLYQELGLFIQNIPEIGSENFANSIKF